MWSGSVGFFLSSKGKIEAETIFKKPQIQTKLKWPNMIYQVHTTNIVCNIFIHKYPKTKRRRKHKVLLLNILDEKA